MKPRPSAFAIVPLALLLPGCATIGGRPSTASTVATPTTWTQTAIAARSGALDTAALVDWWKRFNDPVLDALISDALAHNPDVRIACR